MTDRTYIRTINEFVFDKTIIFSIIKKIVNYYYNIFSFQPNIFKKKEKMSINITEHKNCLAILKAAVDSNINLTY